MGIICQLCKNHFDKAYKLRNGSLIVCEEDMNFLVISKQYKKEDFMELLNKTPDSLSEKFKKGNKIKN